MATGQQPWTDKDVLMLRTYLEQGMRSADIARAMRTSYYRVKDKIRGLKDARKLERRNIERSRDIMHGYSRRAGAHVEKVERTCLCCGSKFTAEGRYLRLCPTHRVSSW